MADERKNAFLELKDIQNLQPFQGEKRTKIGEEIRKIELENDAFEQDIKLKKRTLFILFIFLGIETIAIFVFSGLQATKVFEMEEWSFKLLVAATISQITYMLQFAVKHLFSKNKN